MDQHARSRRNHGAPTGLLLGQGANPGCHCLGPGSRRDTRVSAELDEDRGVPEGHDRGAVGHRSGPERGDRDARRFERRANGPRVLGGTGRVAVQAQAVRAQGDCPAVDGEDDAVPRHGNGARGNGLAVGEDRTRDAP
jgi:hypothetical protein